ncbi:hypothetical protein F4212_13280 [Candidatus Poribacteria bacterium]|nr:hypothetical protein [Candidatus Poribacteria bacterium]
MRIRGTKRLVIDTDVVQSSGSENATDPRAVNCRDFLKAVRFHNYRVVVTREINAEWKRHKSGFAHEWKVSMYVRRRIVDINPPENDALHDKITTTTNDPDEVEVMEKDFHLLQAALETDKIIISLDQTVRILFANASHHVGEIRIIIWVNPERTEEQPIAWLQNGAPPEAHRQLSAYPTQ